MCAYRALICGGAELINDARLIEEVRRGIRDARRAKNALILDWKRLRSALYTMRAS